jgi:hypothetical protein
MYYLGSFSKDTPGDYSFVLPFSPKGLRFTISSDNSSPGENAVAHVSTGMTDGSISRAHSSLSQGTVNLSRYSELYCLMHFLMVDDASKRIISATKKSIVGNIVTLTFDRATPGYYITVEAIG